MTDASGWPVVIVESPFSGDMVANKAYVMRACADCLRRQEVPYASHLFFPEFLDELTPEERELGLTAGYAMWRGASKVVFYTDLPWSNGMQRAYARARDLKMLTELRLLNPVK